MTKRFTRLAPLVATIVLSSGLAHADTDRDSVVACLTSMGSGATTWGECRKQMFSSCATDSVGSPTHLQCLQLEVDDWDTYVQQQSSALTDRLKPGGAIQLTDLMGQWRGYVVNQCAIVAAQNPATPEAARLGCRISEFAGLSTELAACGEGRSNEPYCELKD